MRKDIGEENHRELSGNRNTDPTEVRTQRNATLRETPCQTDALALGTVLKSRYLLEKRLGEGGTGVVFRARDLEQQRIGGVDHYIAVKVLLPHFRAHPDALKTLYEEVRKTRELAHPNIVGVYDCQQDGEQAFMTMQYLEGKTLDALLGEDYARGLPWERARSLIEGMGDALSYAHDRGVIHCDFKPSNVFITASGVAKVLDFGIARAMRGGHRRFDPGTLGGLTPAYASPEMICSWRGEESESGRSYRPDQRDDVYSLACVVFELLTGSHPFVGRDAEQARREKLVCPRVPRLSARQNAAIAKAMAFDRERRTVRVEEFIGDLLSTPRIWSLPRLVAVLAMVALIGASAYYTIDKFVRSPAPHAVSPAKGAIPEKSIAVLPFVDMSEKKDQEYFSDGLSEELLDLLAQVPDLRVPARTSSFFFKGKQTTISEIAKALGVAYVLEGSIRKSGSTMRVTAQLIRADTGYHLWSKSYDRDIQDIFKVQDELAAAVVGALKATMASAQQSSSYRTSNSEAYNQFLLGRQFMDRSNFDDLRRAAAAYRNAIALDPGYATAYADLAWVEIYLLEYEGDPAAGRRAAVADAEKAVALAPNDAAAYTSRGYVRYYVTWDWVGARADFETSLKLDASASTAQYGYARLLAGLGQLSAAIAASRRATELDPLSSFAWNTLTQFLIADGQLDAARIASRRALEIGPEKSRPLYTAGVLDLLQREPENAVTMFRRCRDDEQRLSGVAMAEHTIGHVRESQRALDELIATQASCCAYQVAEVYAWRGEREQAFEWLDRAYRQFDGALSDMRVDPLLSSLHDDPRYKALLRKMNLPD